MRQRHVVIRWLATLAMILPLAGLVCHGAASAQTPPDLTRQRADQGDTIAQFNLGLMYNDGERVPQDFGQAAAWYRQAADQGFARAQYNLGVMYDNGEGVPQDPAEAVAWWRRAADVPLAE